MLVAIGLNGTLFSSLASGAKLHVVFAVDTKAERVGRDLTVFWLWASLSTDLPEDSWQRYSVDSENMSEPAILEKIRAVPVEADDTLMFVYVGHGAYDATLGTYLTPSATTGAVLSASRIVQEIKARGTRLGVSGWPKIT
jgi:hypothetical protein